MFKWCNKNAGFTFIEILVTVAVGGLLMIFVYNTYIYAVKTVDRYHAKSEALAEMQIFQSRLSKEIRECRDQGDTVQPYRIANTAGIPPGEGGDLLILVTHAFSDQYDSNPADAFLEPIEVRYRYNQANRCIQRKVESCVAGSTETNMAFNSSGIWHTVLRNVERSDLNAGLFRDVTTVDGGGAGHLNLGTSKLIEITFQIPDKYDATTPIFQPRYRYAVRSNRL